MLRFKKITLLIAALLVSLTTFNVIAQTADDDNDINLSPIEKNGKWGLINNHTGKEVVPCKYDGIKIENENLEGGKNENFAVIQEAGKWGLYNMAANQLVIPCKYDYILAINENLAAIWIGDKKTGKRGLFNINIGKEIEPCKYDDIITDTEDGLIHAIIGDDIFYFNSNGERVVP